MHNRVIVQSRNAAALAKRLPPIRTKLKSPPLSEIVEIHCALRPLEHKRAGTGHLQWHAWIVSGIRRRLRKRAITSRRDKYRELAISHRRLIDPETIDTHASTRTLLGIELIRAHDEVAARQTAHTGSACAGTHCTKL